MNDNYKWLGLVPKGWINWTHEMIDKCEQIDSTYRIIDLKEKWGCLQVYSSCKSDNFLDIESIEDYYEKYSGKICCQCGKPATKVSSGWVLPFCDDCYKRRN